MPAFPTATSRTSTGPCTRSIGLSWRTFSPRPTSRMSMIVWRDGSGRWPRPGGRRNGERRPAFPGSTHRATPVGRAPRRPPRSIGAHGRGAMAGLIDVHCHWFVFDHPSPRIATELTALERAGYSGLVVMPLGGLGLAAEKIPLLLPPSYREWTGLQDGRGWRLDDVESCLEFQADWAGQDHSLEIIPFLDVRGWDGEADLTSLFAGGMRGIKNILVLEEDRPN